MRTRHLGFIATLAVFFTTTAVAAGKCQLQALGTLPVDMQGGRPLIWTQINGVKARFLLDTGEFYSTISRDAAAQYHLDARPPLDGSLPIMGTGGSQDALVTTVDEFGFLGMTLSKVQFMVLDQGIPSDVAGGLGQNLLRVSDVEYDLANGAVHFFKPVGCNGHPLAYWAAGTQYSFVDLEPTDVRSPHMRTEAMINGHRVTAWLVTGGARSSLSLEAAERAGIRPDSPDVKFLGLSVLGRAHVKTWLAPISSFQFGGEKITNTHLLIVDYGPEVSSQFPDLLLASDFFLSHHIYVAYSQDKLYFTYNGGSVFNLNAAGFTSVAARQSTSDAPTDAAGFRRRGMAYASMREFDLALADLTQACELAPRDAENVYERGTIYAKDGQFEQALQDFSAAITLQPEDIDARMARADLLQSHPGKDPADTIAKVRSDLDAVSRVAPPTAAVRLTLSSMYGNLGDYSTALIQVDQWLDNHRLVDEQAEGLNERCWLRASANRDLQAALDDCNRALVTKPGSPADTGSLITGARTPLNPGYLDSRGLVYLRLGDPKNAIRDYDAALQAAPNMYSSLYGRGLAELRVGQRAQGHADLAAAEMADSSVAKEYEHMGLTP